jgi:hypothetical protein
MAYQIEGLSLAESGPQSKIGLTFTGLSIPRAHAVRLTYQSTRVRTYMHAAC